MSPVPNMDYMYQDDSLQLCALASDNVLYLAFYCESCFLLSNDILSTIIWDMSDYQVLLLLLLQTLDHKLLLINISSNDPCQMDRICLHASNPCLGINNILNYG